MKRSLLLGVVMLVLAPSLDATSVQCMSQRCAKDQKPPACCKPPPCQFFHELTVSKAYRHALTVEQAKFSRRLGVLDEDDNYTERPTQKEFWRDMRRQMKKAHRKFAKCPESYFYRPPPTLLVNEYDESCRIEGYIEGELQNLDVDTVKAASNSCSELVEAEFAAAEVELAQCNSDKGALPATVQADIAQELAKENAHIDSLESSLMRYWSACSIVADAATARRVAAAGLEALKKPPAPPKSTAKRSRHS